MTLVRAQRLAFSAALRDPMFPWKVFVAKSEKQVLCCCTKLYSVRYNLLCVDCSLTFNEDALPQRKRPARHEFLMCISRETDPITGALVSAFADCSLFHRHHISQCVEPLQTSEYINPLRTNLEFGAGHRVGNSPNLSEEALLKQWVTGMQMYTKADFC